MKIGENIISLRKARSLTQEAVASSLGVSVAAVSKWETGVAYPDIELLPKIAGLFDVSVDYLLGYDRTVADKTVEEHIAHACNLIVEHDNKAAVEYMASVAVRYPNDIKVKIANAGIIRAATCGSNKSQKQKDLLNTAEKILLSVNENELTRDEHDEMFAVLCDIYRIEKKYDKAADALKKIKRNERVHPEHLEYMLSLERGDTENAVHGMQEVIYKAFDDIISACGWHYGACYGKPEKVIAVNEFVLRLLDAVTCGSQSVYDAEYSCAYECLAYMYARLGEKETAISCFEKAVDYAIRSDTVREYSLNKLSLFDKLGDEKYIKNHRSIDNFIMALNSTERKEYDLIMNDERFKNAVAKITEARNK